MANTILGEFYSEKIVEYLRNYTLPIVVIALIVAISYGIWHHQNEKTSAMLGDKMYQAMSANINQKQKLLTEVSASNHNYKYIATLFLADLLNQQGKHEKAMDLYKKLSEESEVERFISDIAKQRLMLLNHQKIDTHNIYYFTNTAMGAMSLIQKGKIEEGREVFKNLKENFEAPSMIKELADEIIHATN